MSQAETVGRLLGMKMTKIRIAKHIYPFLYISNSLQ
jgi:hypothetical protein